MNEWMKKEMLKHHEIICFVTLIERIGTYHTYHDMYYTQSNGRYEIQHVDVNVNVYVNVNRNTYVYANAYVYVNMNMNVNVYVYVYVNMNVNIKC